ncbi:MAG: MupG family TIM beta-alpha barrel fold protein [Erysipelotrichaceae bacterium]
MKRLGISVYPQHEKIEETYEYLRLAGKYGFKRVFTCLLSANKSKKETIDTFTSFCNCAHDNGLIVSIDTNPKAFDFLGATPLNLSIFKQMGVDIIRLDGHFSEFEDIEITKNEYGIIIEYNSSCTTPLEYMILNGANRSNMWICSNFYPQQFTGIGLDRFKQFNELYLPLGLNSGVFICSQEKNTHGPWPVYDGLPTLEIHRYLPIDVQLRHLVALGYNNDFLIGNAFASEEEMKIMSNIDLNKININIDLIEHITSLEKEIVLSDFHASRDDCNELIIRSSMTRVLHNGEISFRENKQQSFKRGDVLIVNNNLEYYSGELIIVLKDIPYNSNYNLVGRIPEQEHIIIDCIKPRYSFKLMIKG